MKKLTFILLCLLFISAHVFAETKEESKYKVNFTPDKNSPTGVYIPENLEDCFTELNKMLYPDFKEEIKSSTQNDLVKYHRNLGLWIRNNWGLWKGSRLNKYFNQIGIFHPDDMSSIIINSFWKILNNKPIQLGKQIKYYQNYWKEIKEKENKKR